jgi:hypothetical protein
MRLSFLARLTGAFCLLLAIAAAADATGKWAADVSGGNGQTAKLTFNLKTEGGKVTGSVSMVLNGNSGEFPISDGTINGDQISFKQVMGEMTIVYKGKLAGDEIQFTRERADGEGHRQPFTARKAS